jgi:hypothetical protein
MEKLLLKHMWKIAFFFWLIVFVSWILQYINLPVWWFIQSLFWITEIKNTISTQYMFTTIWAIFAFWYWYKKYERDKELEIIEKYCSKYNFEKNQPDINISNIFNIWYEEFFMYKKWYITETLWNEWKYWIYQDIIEFVDNDFQIYENDSDSWNSNLTNMKSCFWFNCMVYHKKIIVSKTDNIWREFWIFLYKLLENHFDWYEKLRVKTCWNDKIKLWKVEEWLNQTKRFYSIIHSKK